MQPTLLFYKVFLLLIVRSFGFRVMNTSTSRLSKEIGKLYAEQLGSMLHILDEDIDPCEDFFAHACGYYHEYIEGVSIASSGDDFVVIESSADTKVPIFLLNQEDRMHFFEAHKNRFETQPGKVLGSLYSDCKQRNQHDVLHEKPLPQWPRMLHEIPFLAQQTQQYSNWPLLHYQWQELELRNASPDWVRLAAQLAAHGVNSFLNIYFAEGTIFVSPVESQLDVKCTELSAIREGLLPLLNGRTPQVAEVIASELWTFCQELMGQLPAAAEELPVSSAATPETVDIFIDDTIVAYFQWYFSILNFTAREVETARKLPTDVPRLSAILTLMRTTHPRIIFNFIIWQAYEQLRYEDCFLLTEEFEQLLFAEYWQWHVFAAHFSRDVAMAAYLYHTTRFQKHRKAVLMGEHWDRFLHARLQRSDFNLPRLLGQYANTFLHPTNLTHIYGAAPLTAGAFFCNLLTLRRLRLRNSFFAPYIDSEDYNHPSYFLRRFLHFSILSIKRPLFHYFATEGFDLWHAADLLYSSDGFYTALDCLERQSLLLFDDAPIFQVLNEPEVAAVFRFYRAFLESYRDYQFWLQGETFAFAEDFVLEYFHMSAQRVMFYATAQLYCGRNDAVFAPRVNRSFMNMPQFAEAFECEADAPMNPLVKCMINKCDD